MPHPFGTPYAAMYAHGTAYPHPLVPMVKIPLTNLFLDYEFPFQSFSLCSIFIIWSFHDASKVSNPLSVEPTKSATSKDKSSNKKLKEIDRTAVSAGSGNSKRAMSSRY